MPGREQLQYGKDRRDLGKPDPNNPFDELGLHLSHFAANVRDRTMQIIFGGKIREVDVLGLPQRLGQRFGLGIGEARRGQVLDGLMGVERGLVIGGLSISP